MAHKWKDIRKQLSPEAEERIRQGVKEAAVVMTLHQLREARSLTQVNLARVLEINQGSLSKMEKRTDMYVSSLRNFIQAMGGQLQVRAIFPEGEVQIDQFENVAEAKDAPMLASGIATAMPKQEGEQLLTRTHQVHRCVHAGSH
jgi:DNA-binding XRE family transcriptional regulator